jgi:broad specificity phosphatase PhoE
MIDRNQRMVVKLLNERRQMGKQGPPQQQEGTRSTTTSIFFHHAEENKKVFVLQSHNNNIEQECIVNDDDDDGYNMFLEFEEKRRSDIASNHQINQHHDDDESFGTIRTTSKITSSLCVIPHTGEVTRRRNVLQKLVLSAPAALPSFWTQISNPASACVAVQDSSVSVIPNTSSSSCMTDISRSNTSLTRSPNLDCLLNLPPVSKDYARIFLCRHGQTENNRLRLVQGARVDPSINNLGRMQAIRLGEAFAMLKNNTSSLKGSFPTMALHSTLKRARETAAVASLVMGNAGLTEEEYALFVKNMFTEDDDMKNGTGKNYKKESSLILENLSYLGEVDFGIMEGKSVNEAKAEMMTTFAQWAIGKIDVKNGDDGESARSVFTRINMTLKYLKEIVSSSNGTTAGRSVFAVSHSTYLRILLALVMDVPLLQAASFEQKNCCINVLDISLKEMMNVTPKSNIFGGRLSMAPSDFCLTIPKVQVVRMNEVGHLEGLFL